MASDFYMRLILVMVTSLDGKSTKGDLQGSHSLNSVEDQAYFQDIIENARLIIMGRETYENAKGRMEHRNGRLRIVMTNNPQKYESEKICGQLEFTNETPTDLIRRLEDKGFTEGYLVGGAKTNTEFFKQNLVTEVWQTLEPKLLGSGKGIIEDETININLKLNSSKKLNTQGTILLKYSVETN